ncbi:MAG TPA: thiazole biosynthesis adenylyltransferase ThiF [Phycisphaerales bacterium]|nr:thiazole biosynthesis adenylyltransferase ThiF [Phycisphaerales bacterium]
MPETNPSRYHRQTLLSEIGSDGQAKLAQSKIAIVGIGAIGCASADALTRAGVGQLVLIDRDIVELSNLQRQCLYTETDADRGTPKAVAAKRRLSKVNSMIRIQPIVADLTPENAVSHLDRADIIVDGTDNFETRYLLNDYAVRERTPMICGGAIATRGTIMPTFPGIGPCLRCLHPEVPVVRETCDTVGVLGPIVQIVGARQAALAMRVLIHGEGSIPIQLEEFDAWTGQARSFDITTAKEPDCPCCVRRQFTFLDGVRGSKAIRLCGRGAVQVSPAHTSGIDLVALAQRMQSSGDVIATDLFVRTRIQSHNEPGTIELTVFGDGRAIIKGTEDPAQARMIYARYIGS